MNKSLLAILMLLAFPLVVNAAHVFIWNYDPLDAFFDDQVGDSVDCAYWLEQTLDARGHTFITDTSLPTDLDSYDVVFVTLGWYRC